MIVIICLPAIWHLLYPGYFSVHDDMHPAWILEMYRAIQSGQNPPSWAPDLSYGYGYPLFHFIYPLPYYLGSVFYALFGDLIWSVKSVYIISILGSAFAMYKFARHHYSLAPSLLATILYIYTPYRAVNIYVRGALGESLSWVFIPLIFLSIDKATKKMSFTNIFLAGLSIGGLLLTHNIAAYAVAPFAVLYGIFQITKSKDKIKTFSRIILISFIGLSVSAYFWIPALIDKRLMVEDTIFNFQDHFPFWKQLIYSKWGYGASLWGPDDGLSFQIGIVNIFNLFISGIIVLYQIFKIKKVNPTNLFFLISSLFVLFLMNIRSIWIWQNFPLMTYFQFPWRLLILMTFFTSLLIAICFSYLDKISNKARFILFALLSLSIFLINHSYFQPDKHINISDETILNKYFPLNPLNTSSSLSSQYENIQEEYLRLPLSVQNRPTQFQTNRIISTNPQTQIDWQQINPSTYKVMTNGPQTNIIASVYNFPLWQVLIDTNQVQTTDYGPHGQLYFAVPSGEHEILIRIKSTGWRAMLNIYSQTIIVTMISVIFYSKIISRNKFQ